MRKTELKEYYAKSRLKDGKQPTVKYHLSEVSRLAKKYGKETGQETEAGLAGLFHDFGKYSDAFQEVLAGTRTNVDHAQGGAAFLNCFNKRGSGLEHIIEAVHGHHSGLDEISKLRNILEYNVQGGNVSFHEGKFSGIVGPKEYQEIYQRFLRDFQDFKMPKLSRFISTDDTNLEISGLENMLYTRMLFSCLVDADYSVSALDELPDYLEKTELIEFRAEEMYIRLLEYKQSLGKKSTADSVLNSLRNQLFEQCGKMGKQSEGLFTLTAPTGTGKTLALLNFALQHCMATGKKRVIVVLPFLTLTEQNQRTYSEIVSDILLDHSQSNLEDEAREFASRWSVPFIITTSVKFFESLFARKPTDCRKLHSIANSVVLFDEAQSLPPELTAATLRTVNELCRRYHCTMVFSTATQPAFESALHEEWLPVEIMPEHEKLYTALKRTCVEWRLREQTSLEDVAFEMKNHRSVCAIVNLRKHARKLYLKLKEFCAEEELFFMTTDLCAAHRNEVIERLRSRLEAGLPCRLVATQCIEAGVDLDFDVLYRSLAPLDSIIQAAGRCNRNGRLLNGGLVTIFEPAEDGKLYPGDWYGNAAELVKRLVLTEGVDIHNPEHIKNYYLRLLKSQKDKKELRKAITERDFTQVEKEYKLIKNQGRKVIVPYNMKESGTRTYELLCEQIKKEGITPALMREAAPITVTTYLSSEELNIYAEEIFSFSRSAKEKIPSGYFVLRPQYEVSLYKKDMGLQFPEMMVNEVIF